MCRDTAHPKNWDKKIWYYLFHKTLLGGFFKKLSGIHWIHNRPQLHGLTQEFQYIYQIQFSRVIRNTNLTIFIFFMDYEVDFHLVCLCPTGIV